MSAPASTGPHGESPSAKPGLRRKLATAAVMTALVASAFEGTVVTSAMPTIARELGGAELYAWVFSGFLLASTIAVPVFGKLADRLGRRPVFALGMALFLAGSALCGTATTMPALVAFRVLQGLGVGAIGPIVPTISADLYTLEERARVQGLFTAAWGGANVAGPVIGGSIVLHASWRWVFLVNVPVGAIAVTLLLASYVDPPRRKGPPIDVAGALTLALGSAAMLLALERDVHVGGGGRLALAAIALACGAAFVRSAQRAPDPLLPLDLLSDPVVRAGAVGSLFAGALIYAPAAYVPLWIARDRGGDALHAGAALVPMLVGWSVGSTLGVPAMVRWGMRAVAIGGLAIAATGGSALALGVAQHAPVSAGLASLALLGLGLGPFANAAVLGPQARVGWSRRGVVTSLVHAARALGGSLAVALLDAVGSDGGGASALRFAELAAVAWGGVLVLGWTAPRGRLDGVAAHGAAVEH